VRRGRVAVVASIALIASAVAGEGYRDLVEAYVHGDRGAVDRVAARTPSDLRTELLILPLCPSLRNIGLE